MRIKGIKNICMCLCSRNSWLYLSARDVIGHMNKDFVECLGILHGIQMGTPVFSPTDFHKVHFTRVVLDFLMTEEESLTTYLRQVGMNSVSSTVAYAVENGLAYDPFTIPAVSWTDEFVIILHGMIGDVKKDEDYSRQDYQWILAGLMVGQHGTMSSIRGLLKQMEDPVLQCSLLAYRVLVKDAASHIQVPELPDVQ